MEKDLEIKTLDKELARSFLPPRERAANKGSFGRALLAVGSGKYRGAAYLAASSALRCGAGYVEVFSEEDLVRDMVKALPEIIYVSHNPYDMLTDVDISILLSASERASSILIGCGCGISSGLASMLRVLLSTPGAPLVLDADAINVIARSEELRLLLSRASRRVVVTPHPLEASRLFGIPLSEIEGDRVGAAARFARENSLTVVLKGNGTVITDGRRAYLNTTGSTALAKAGSGDVLAGAVVSLIAAGAAPMDAAALAVYLHGAAGDALSRRLSDYGVTPSDLPIAIAEEIKALSER